MSKQAMREEAERLIRETMAKKALVIKQGNTRIEAICGKCGAPNRVQAEKGTTRVKYVCSARRHRARGSRDLGRSSYRNRARVGAAPALADAGNRLTRSRTFCSYDFSLPTYETGVDCDKTAPRGVS